MAAQSIAKEKSFNYPVFRSFVVMQETSKEVLALRMDVVSDTDFSLLSRLFPNPGEKLLFHFGPEESPAEQDHQLKKRKRNGQMTQGTGIFDFGDFQIHI